jgi:cytochrome bd-type quinol oxidase subunit 2
MLLLRRRKRVSGMQEKLIFMIATAIIIYLHGSSKMADDHHRGIPMYYERMAVKWEAISGVTTCAAGLLLLYAILIRNKTENHHYMIYFSGLVWVLSGIAILIAARYRSVGLALAN